MEFPKTEVGKRIRYLRKSQGLTSEELAKLAGISQSMISQIERGQVSPSLETLWKLSHSLQVPVFSFFEMEESNIVKISRAKETKVVKRVRPNVSYELLSPSSGKQMSFFKMVVEPGEDLNAPLMYHVGEECGIMLKGSLRIEVEGEIHIINEGDSVYFDSSLPHRFMNLGEENAVSIWAMTHSF
ncbi:helix-turn-helix domain-containing protein [Psychrobacillus vulpis]|uniref:Helix-turn-helix domain-containing protein n=1 Tax=Psychrobacillus vulpis TaxID=2325572 RepID=A0A544TUV1_9BACI|nr:helix-turn-helix domain-containing protein [Psychrobacillus vulpis]TQR21217.1 helix-turn-helix domain-containing protein [Psychrobacillus vulpis]